MTPARVPRARKSPPLTETQERILKAVNEVPFMSVQEVWRWVLFNGCESSARAHLRVMAGGDHADDNTNDGYLCRVPLPTRGNWLWLYTISSWGAKYLRKIGVEVSWRGRPYKLRNYSFTYLRHQHATAKLIVALHCFVRENPAYQVSEILTSYDLLPDPPCATVTADGQEVKVAVIPDAWADVVRLADGQETALWFEIDNCTEYRKKFQQLLRARLALTKNGFYADYFGIAAIRLCYVVTRATPEHRAGELEDAKARERQLLCTRLRSLQKWTDEVIDMEISEKNRQAWREKFYYFAAVDYTQLHNPALFTQPEWHQLGSTEQVALFDAITSTEQENTDGDAS